MSASQQPATWRQWLRQPQKVWLRRAIFQVHLWSGIAAGLYIVFISVTGSVLVYRNELYEAATPVPLISQATTPTLSDEELAAAATRAHPGYTVAGLRRPSAPDEAVEVTLRRADASRSRLFDPRTGEDLGRPATTGIWLVSTLIELHADLLAGETGRKINGLGAVAVLLVALTGLVVWWPGISRWRRSLVLRRGVGWKRLVWDLHSTIGFWSLTFIIVFALSGIYLSIPTEIHALADRIEPPTATNAGTRAVDGILYWLAYLHFGRINGIGIPCSGPGVCDQSVKAVWAVFGLAPAAMFATGVVVWWNRVVRRALRRRART